MNDANNMDRRRGEEGERRRRRRSGGDFQWDFDQRREREGERRRGRNRISNFAVPFNAAAAAAVTAPKWRSVRIEGLLWVGTEKSSASLQGLDSLKEVFKDTY